jgi:hypothetical protein
LTILVLVCDGLEYYVNERTTKLKLIRVSYHLFGFVTGALLGLVFYNDTTVQSERNRKMVKYVSLIVYMTVFTLLVVFYFLQIGIKYTDLGEQLALQTDLDFNT